MRASLRAENRIHFSLTRTFGSAQWSSGAISLRQIAAVLNERHIKTARGKDWTETRVMRVLGQEKAPLGSA
nr:recombinase family protein [Microvirga sp. KLBC 81]